MPSCFIVRNVSMVIQVKRSHRFPGVGQSMNHVKTKCPNKKMKYVNHAFILAQLNL